MPREAQLEPAWLIGLLVNWGRSVRRRELGGLGYYSVNPMLRDGIPGRTVSLEPEGYSFMDYEAVETALQNLRPVQQVAVIRYVLPEKARAIQTEWGYSTDSWLRHLRDSLALLSVALDRNNSTCERERMRL